MQKCKTCRQSYVDQLSFIIRYFFICMAPLWYYVLPSTNPSRSSLDPSLPNKPMIRYPAGKVTKLYDPPVPPNLGDFVPLLVMKVSESIRSPDLYSTWVMYSSLGTVHGSRYPPPVPPNWGESIVVTPSLSWICMLSISVPDLMRTLATFKVGWTWDHSNGPPPFPP